MELIFKKYTLFYLSQVRLINIGQFLDFKVVKDQGSKERNEYIKRYFRLLDSRSREEVSLKPPGYLADLKGAKKQLKKSLR